MKIQKIEDMIIKPKNIGAYGKNGSGKTTLASSLPKPIVYVDINEKGLASVPYEMRKDIYVIEISSIEELHELVQTIQEKKLKDVLGVEPESIVFDTVTQINELFSIYAHQNQHKFLSKNNNFDKWKAMDELARMSKVLMLTVKRLDLNTLWLFQEGIEKDEMGNIKGSKVLLPSHMRNIFLSETDVILRCMTKLEEDGKISYGVSLQNSVDDIKVRTLNEDVKGIKNPTWKKIQKEIN